jgi:hypothetical protein
VQTALITTTINTPRVLSLYRAHAPDVRFFVAVDRKTPDEALSFLPELPDCQVIDAGERWKCTELIGWNCIQRRNLALLEALAWGAEIVISVDDDNTPLDEDYFRYFNEVLRRQPFSGLCASGSEWFDVGTLLDPIAPHRGFPIERDGRVEFIPVTDAKVGVAAGVCLGDPDISAYTRIANHPAVHRVSQLLEAGIVIDPRTWTVFNSQNTAVLRELAPAWSMWCGVGRYDDIFASLVVQRIMRDRGTHVHFGKPFVWQHRNRHNLVTDLQAEIFGMKHIVELASFIGALHLDGRSVIGDCRLIFQALRQFPWLPLATSAAALAFLDDAERAMG